MPIRRRVHQARAAETEPGAAGENAAEDAAEDADIAADQADPADAARP